MRKIIVSKKTAIIGICVVILGIASTLLVWAPWRASLSDSSSITPPFQAILPSRVSIASLNGWQKLTPPDGAAVYVFVDSIDNVSISVSQQPLPDSLKDSTGAKVAAAAKGYNATKILYADTTKVYVGANADGPQSVIFTKNNLLVLIKSRGIIKDGSWTSYVSALK